MICTEVLPVRFLNLGKNMHKNSNATLNYKTGFNKIRYYKGFYSKVRKTGVIAA